MTAPLTVAAASPRPCPVCRGAGWLRADVPLGHPDFGRARMCGCLRERAAAERVGELRRRAHLEVLGHLTFDRFDGTRPDAARAYAAARRFARSPAGWLVLVGPHGAGKTHLAVAIAHERIERGEAVVVASVVDLLDDLRAAIGAGGAEYAAKAAAARDVPLLVLDDLGEESPSAWTREQLFALLNHRWARRLPTVVVTSREPTGLDAALRARLTDRDVAVTVRLEAPFRRPDDAAPRGRAAAADRAVPSRRAVRDPWRRPVEKESPHARAGAAGDDTSGGMPLAEPRAVAW